ncbi:hypothetical protein [Arcobacter porcinus]|uniref:Uncharacterized protein n=1 Tax=Arcobacter porcinus TaxID=1935204 RepID=A0A5C2HJI9_9BACT|nr:hypothetical protein [Arcobacter porcinus]OCL85318.1 hypothetical protein AAX27_02156 [Aliarcobacter thereius]OCL81825.1 hypothetical protein AAW29_01800 [Arcobacter porcinus]OCL82327.1 hypothetical protein AAW30_01614 [Arcobacter porcinus]OCL86278.1 hypothetical protein AAX30_01622 [Arcobacter porcinus]QEP40900.1 hypothetical protein APORC_1306 [Arcobacter porcinus]
MKLSKIKYGIKILIDEKKVKNNKLEYISEQLDNFAKSLQILKVDKYYYACSMDLDYIKFIKGIEKNNWFGLNFEYIKIENILKISLQEFYKDEYHNDLRVILENWISNGEKPFIIREDKEIPIIIEAYNKEFNSKKSRVIFSNFLIDDIKLPFKEGMIKLINEDNNFIEIYFHEINNILTFSSNSFLKDVLLDISSKERISDILVRQNIDNVSYETILNCFSIFQYIINFRKDEDRIEEIKQLNLLKIKKGIRKFNCTFIVRGHSRNYNGESIWINPFFKGKGKFNQKVHKLQRDSINKDTLKAMKEAKESKGEEITLKDL